MLNQSFSAENFRKIIDFENRKGVFLEGKYFTNLKTITDDIKGCNKNIASKRKDRSISAANTRGFDFARLFKSSGSIRRSKNVYSLSYFFNHAGNFNNNILGKHFERNNLGKNHKNKNHAQFAFKILGLKYCMDELLVFADIPDFMAD